MGLACASCAARLRIRSGTSRESGIVPPYGYNSRKNTFLPPYSHAVFTSMGCTLPALVLIFHPYYVQNFKISCEGLARWKGGPAWQMYFRQRPDKPNTIRTYQVGAEGQAYPVALKGRAWIAADSSQIVRLETDLIDPLPQIRLVADHAAIEYGPVHFQARNLDMWLPQNAEVHYDWRGRRSHRRHSFRNYLLFAVDDKTTHLGAQGRRPGEIIS